MADQVYSVQYALGAPLHGHLKHYLEQGATQKTLAKRHNIIIGGSAKSLYQLLVLRRRLLTSRKTLLRKQDGALLAREKLSR